MIFDRFQMHDQVAVVVGGTGGIGGAIALGLAEAGADVVATSRNGEKVHEITAQITSIGRTSLALPTDATNEDEMRLFSEQVLAFYGKVDILVNAAGINIRKPIVDMAYEDWRRVMQTNLDSVFLGTKYFARSMITRKYGKIINIGSLNSVIASTNLSAYAASKGGVVQFTKAAAVELSRHNITVNALLPGYFDTEMTAPVISNSSTCQKIVERTPMRRIGSLDELIGAVIFLASEASRFVTGETLAVDGGFLAFGVDLTAEQ